MQQNPVAGLKLRLAQTTDADKVSDLRITAYQAATGTKLANSDFLRWSPNDESAAVITIENPSGQAVSSVRGLKLAQQAELEALFDITVDTRLTLPILALDKAVTSLDHRRLGLSGVLRYLLIEGGKNANVGCMVLTINEGASRIPHLKEIGFEFCDADVSHRTDSDFNNSSKVLLAVLNQTSFAQAVRVAQDSLKFGLSCFLQDDELTEHITEKLARLY